MRSLALFRLLFGALWIADWFARWPDLEAFYSPNGVLPNFAPLSPGSVFHYSLLTGALSLPAVKLLFVGGLVSYVGFFLGFHTRVSHAASLAFFGSVLSRNDMITQGGDMVLISMGLWTWFLPLGARFSIDAWRNPEPRPATRSTPSIAALAAVAQLGLIYTFSACVKNAGELWRDGTALYYVLQLDNYVRPLGAACGQAPLPVIRLLTYATLYLEWAGLPLLLLPVWQPRLRRVFMFGLGTMHLGTALLLELGNFPFVMLACYALLLGADDWQWLAQRARWLQTRSRSLRKLQARLAQIRPSFHRSVRVENGPGAARLEHGGRAALWGVTQVVVTFLLAAVLLNGYNLSWAGPRQAPRLPEPVWLRGTLEMLRLVHGWFMFAPNPLTSDGWWVIDGTSESGTHVDPLTGRTPSWDKPEGLRRRWNVSWQIYMLRLCQGELHDYRTYYGRYLTQLDRRHHPPGKRLIHFDFYYVTEPTLPPGSPRPFPSKPTYLWSFDCRSGRVSTQRPGSP